MKIIISQNDDNLHGAAVYKFEGEDSVHALKIQHIINKHGIFDGNFYNDCGATPECPSCKNCACSREKMPGQWKEDAECVNGCDGVNSGCSECPGAPKEAWDMLGVKCESVPKQTVESAIAALYEYAESLGLIVNINISQRG